MIGGYIKNAMSHPVVGAGAGGLIGYHAMSGSLFGGLLMAGTIGTYLQARKMKAAKEAARQAAITTAQQCGDPNSPDCIAQAKSAAIAAGQVALAGGRSIWARGIIMAAIAFALVAFVNLIK
jgi:hypothetical protein